MIDQKEAKKRKKSNSFKKWLMVSPLMSFYVAMMTHSDWLIELAKHANGPTEPK